MKKISHPFKKQYPLLYDAIHELGTDIPSTDMDGSLRLIANTDKEDEFSSISITFKPTAGPMVVIETRLMGISKAKPKTRTLIELMQDLAANALLQADIVVYDKVTRALVLQRWFNPNISAFALQILIAECIACTQTFRNKLNKYDDEGDLTIPSSKTVTYFKSPFDRNTHYFDYVPSKNKILVKQQ